MFAFQLNDHHKLKQELFFFQFHTNRRLSTTQKKNMWKPMD